MDIPIISNIIDLHRIFLDRPRLKIKASYGFKVFDGGKSPPMLIVSVVNIGRRPIKLNATGLRLSHKKGDVTRNPDWDEPRLPKMLNEFEDHVTYFDIDGVRQKLKELGVDARIAFGYYRDAADNLHKYKIPRGILKLFHE